jgi:NTP pyrophosphatase (non-canonical NTP hydrolase)
LVALSNWIDQSTANAKRDPEAVTWGRLAKVSEECGEVIQCYIGATGQNPRKGVTHDIDDVIEELLDVAVTALCAIEHLTEGRQESIDRLFGKIQRVMVRAGIEAEVLTTSLWDPIQKRRIRICATCGDEAAYCDGTRHQQVKA